MQARFILETTKAGESVQGIFYTKFQINLCSSEKSFVQLKKIPTISMKTKVINEIFLNTLQFT